MSNERPTRGRAAVHALLVFAGYSLWFACIFSAPLLRNAYAAESDFYEYYLPAFLSGHPQPAIYTYYATALYAVATTWGRPTAVAA